MIEQAQDFRDESHALHSLLSGLNPARFEEKTQFKDWTINDILQHLHFWNTMADFALMNESKFMALIQELFSGPESMRDFENRILNGLKGEVLLDNWREHVDTCADHFYPTDPGKRLKWAGPDMSARSSITARLMETWAHGQAIYDHLGMERIDADRIKNIAHLGVNTFGWTYAARGREAPENKPWVKLTAPSGVVWEWNTPNDNNRVTGEATEFCQVVAQTRNIADTKLTVVGDVANEWMSMAQCFAGPAENPPPAGTRSIRQTG
jgi:uncharacterized protein (TIGR03084 family)